VITFVISAILQCSSGFAKDKLFEDSSSNCNQVYILEKYAIDHFPNFDPTAMDINISSYDLTWEAGYVGKFDDFAAQNARFKFPILVIEKRTCSIIEVKGR
jgi:hypothetical protein